MSHPGVSVIIPVHSETDRLRETLDSVLGQSYDNVEVIVVSDASDEYAAATESITSPYGDKIKVFKKESSGIASALNFGIKKMTGQYFSWLSPGDAYDPSWIGKLVKAIDGADSVVSISGWTTTTGGGRRSGTRVADRRIEQYPGCFLAFAREIRLNTCAMLVPRELLKNGEPFDGMLPASQDYRMISRLLVAGANLKVVDELLLSLGHRYQQESAVEPSNEDYDFIYSDIVDILNLEDIVGYFGGAQAAVAYYKETLDAGLPRTASFLITKLIKGLIDEGDRESARRMILDDLSRLAETKMSTGADALLSRAEQSKRKRRVLFSSAHWLTGGMERVMSTLFRELENDYEIFLITPYDSRRSRIEVPDYVTNIKIADDLFRKHFDSLILSYALLLDIDVAVGIINMFEKQLNFYKLCKGTKIKTIASNHEYYFYPYKSPAHYRVVEKRLNAFEKCDALVWPTNFSAALCGMYVDNNYVIGNPNKFEVVGAADKKPRGKIILSVGRFDDYVKRIDRILECFSLVLRKVSDAKLVLVGRYDKNAPVRPNDPTTVNDLMHKLAIPSGSVNFVGEVENVQDYYAGARVLLLASNSEGFGMVLNEAACFGTPSVCNYIPGVEDIMSDGENGFITEQDDIESMAMRVSDVLVDNGLWAKLSSNAKKKVVAYDSKHIGDKWRYLIDVLLSAKDLGSMRTKLDNELGYKIKDQRLLVGVLSRELNSVFYQVVENSASEYGNMTGALLILSKVKRLPARLKANAEYEGWLKTGSKVVTRSFRVARNRLKF